MSHPDGHKTSFGWRGLSRRSGAFGPWPNLRGWVMIGAAVFCAVVWGCIFHLAGRL